MFILTNSLIDSNCFHKKSKISNMAFGNNVNPLVSVCILTYNQESTIAETIESILNQDFNFEYEIIIGEDCSTDLTLEICKKYQTLYPSLIKIITSNKNVGLMQNFKRVTNEIRGKYFACCAGDDFWHDRNKLELQFQFMESNLNHGMVHAGCNLLNVNNGETKEFIRKNKEINNVFESILTGTYGNIIASTAFVRTATFRKYTCIDDYILKSYLMEDFPMWLDLSFNSDIGYIAKPLITYRIHAESLSQSNNIEKTLNFLKSRWKVQSDYAIKFKIKKNIQDRIKKDKNAICIGIAYGSNKFKESLFWIKNIEFKYLFKYPSFRHTLKLILSLLSLNKNIRRLKNDLSYVIYLSKNLGILKLL